MLDIYRRDVKQPQTRSRVEKYGELAIKGIILFAIPLPFAAFFTWVWYHWIFSRGLYFNGEMETIITCAWIPMLAIWYGLVTTRVLDTVWTEYKAMRAAAKRGTRGVISFVRLRDERVSALIHAVICALSVVILVAFMVIKYPGVWGGVCAIASTSYLLVLVFIIIKEIDNPCGGLWFIRRIPPLWLGINTRRFHYRVAKLTQKQQQDVKLLEKIIKKCQINQKK